MGIAAKALQLDEMAAGYIGGGSVCEVLQQMDGLGHHADVFAMTKEASARTAAAVVAIPLRSIPAPAPPGSASEPEDSPAKAWAWPRQISTGELIQEQHQGQTTAGPTAPVVQLSSEGALNGLAESLSHQGIEAVAATKPLPGTALLEPELQNVVGAQDEQL